jgi:hypothetical protein
MSDAIYPIGGDFSDCTVCGSPGRFEMLPVARLHVDMRYQRAISKKSADNIRRICAAFNWAKFLPVIVVEDRDGFAVIDGQHRTTAAVTLGIDSVPCYILSCTTREAAGAFAAINGNVTPVTPTDIWFAEIEAGVPETLALKAVLDAAGVTMVRRKDGHGVGETASVNVLRRALKLYGPALLTTILQCIVECGNGNPGMIVGAVVNGIGMAIRTKPEMLSEPTRLFAVFDRIPIAEFVQAAQLEHARTGNPVQFILTRKINGMLASDRVISHAA